MPLVSGWDREAIGLNIAHLEQDKGYGKPRAVAAALREARSSYRREHPQGPFPHHLRRPRGRRRSNRAVPRGHRRFGPSRVFRAWIQGPPGTGSYVAAEHPSLSDVRAQAKSIAKGLSAGSSVAVKDEHGRYIATYEAGTARNMRPRSSHRGTVRKDRLYAVQSAEGGTHVVSRRRGTAGRWQKHLTAQHGTSLAPGGYHVKLVRKADVGPEHWAELESQAGARRLPHSTRKPGRPRTSNRAGKDGSRRVRYVLWPITVFAGGGVKVGRGASFTIDHADVGPLPHEILQSHGIAVPKWDYTDPSGKWLQVHDYDYLSALAALRSYGPRAGLRGPSSSSRANRAPARKLGIGTLYKPFPTTQRAYTKAVRHYLRNYRGEKVTRSLMRKFPHLLWVGFERKHDPDAIAMELARYESELEEANRAGAGNLNRMSQAEVDSLYRIGTDDDRAWLERQGFKPSGAPRPATPTPLPRRSRARRRRRRVRRQLGTAEEAAGEAENQAGPRKRPPARPKPSVRIIGHDGDPTKLDELTPGGILAIQVGGPHMIDTDVPQKRQAQQLAKSFMEHRPPKSNAAFVTVSEVAPTGGSVLLSAWEARERRGKLEWVKAASAPRKPSPVARRAELARRGPPPGYIPWKKEQQALSFAPEMKMIVPPLAPTPPPAPRPVFPVEAGGQARLFVRKHNTRGPGLNHRTAHASPRAARDTSRIPRDGWQPLRTDMKINTAIREQVRSRTGVYAIREAGSPEVIYVGESHTAAPKEQRCRRKRATRLDRRRKVCSAAVQTRRWWKTISRHLYKWEWNFDPRDPRYQDPASRPDEWVHASWAQTVGRDPRADLEIAVWAAPPGAVRELELEKILDLQPLENRRVRMALAEEKRKEREREGEGYRREEREEELEAAPF